MDCVRNDFPGSAPVDFALGYMRESGGVADILRDDALPPCACHIRIEGGRAVVTAPDDHGAMDGLIEAADRLRAGAADWDGGVIVPATAHRGVKLNAPLDARTPSYTDCGDSAQGNIAAMWDRDFWRGLLDRMALQHYNALTLWNLCPFPSMVSVPEYPRAALRDVMASSAMAGGTSRALGFYTEEMKQSLVCLRRMTIEEKEAHWRWMMDYAAARCIDVYVFTWNLYLYGLEDSGYALMESASDEAAKEYLRCSVAALLRAYPRLKGVGVTAGENLTGEWTENQDMGWVRETYGAGIQRVLAEEPERDVTLILRAHMTTLGQMQAAFGDYPGRVEVSAKYAMAHMTATPQPRFVEDFLERLPPGLNAWLTLRNDDFYLFPWADAPFLTELVQHMPLGRMSGFYLGSDGVIWGLERMSREASLRGRYYIDKHAMSVALLGRLGWRGSLHPGEDAAIATRLYPALPPEALCRAWQLASRAVSRVSLCHWQPYDFQWYPEAGCSLHEEDKLTVFHDLNQFAVCPACPGTGFRSVAETAALRMRGGEATDRDALGLAALMLTMVREAEAVALPEAGSAGERLLVRDIRRAGELARYYARKLEAAVYLTCYRMGGGEAEREQAEQAMTEGAVAYERYAESAARDYRPQRLSRLRGVVSPDMFIERAWLDVKLCRERKERL